MSYDPYHRFDEPVTERSYDLLHAEQVHDWSRITLADEYEVRHWEKELDLNEEQLHAVVHAVGDSPEDVRAYLQQLQVQQQVN